MKTYRATYSNGDVVEFCIRPSTLLKYLLHLQTGHGLFVRDLMHLVVLES